MSSKIIVKKNKAISSKKNTSIFHNPIINDSLDRSIPKHGLSFSKDFEYK